MDEYEFVSIPISRRREGSTLSRDYRDEIRRWAADGWTFVQAIPFDGDADPRLDLVFTRKGETQ